jgi:hypothetical protein
MSESNFTLTQTDLHNYFDYKNGVLYWKISKKCVNKGGIAGHVDYLRPYVRITINRQKHLAHRLIYMMFHGFMPKIIDHINGNKYDNRIENLRAATASQNNYNTKPKNKLKNVSLYKRTGKWQVQIRYDKKVLHFGYFCDLELAELVATEARNKYHGKFARHN